MAQSADTIRRIFVAVDLAEEVRHGLAAHLEASLDSPLPGRAALPANWHITLRFLGKLDQVTYETILGRLEGVDLGAPFELQFGGLGAFPRPNRAAVLWLGTTGESDALEDTAAAVEEAVIEAGLMPEERPFHPHLTLSRIRPPEDVRYVLDAVPAFPLRQVVEKITVFESVLGRGPAIYVPLETFPLA